MHFSVVIPVPAWSIDCGGRGVAVMFYILIFTDVTMEMSQWGHRVGFISSGNPSVIDVKVSVPRTGHWPDRSILSRHCQWWHLFCLVCLMQSYKDTALHSCAGSVIPGSLEITTLVSL